jgi:hypothetical protein
MIVGPVAAHTQSRSSVLEHSAPRDACKRLAESPVDTGNTELGVLMLADIHVQGSTCKGEVVFGHTHRYVNEVIRPTSVGTLPVRSLKSKLLYITRQRPPDLVNSRERRGMGGDGRTNTCHENK